MIGKRIRKLQMHRRVSTFHLAHSVVGLTVYAVNADVAAFLALQRAGKLPGYAVDADLADLGMEPGEKVVDWGTLNLDHTSLVGIQAQMVASAARGCRSHDPIEHFVLSFREGERPTREQCEEAVHIVAEVLGVADCQILWATHSNTSNYHIHLIVNRIHPLSGKAILLGDGWDKDRLQQALALVCERQGWSREPGSQFVARGGAVYDVVSNALVRTDQGDQVNPGVRAQRPPKTEEIRLAEAIANAHSWSELHERLRLFGAAYNKKGKAGATVVVGDRAYKPSSLDRQCSFNQLEARLGAFEPDAQRLDHGYERYSAAFKAQLAGLREQRAWECARLDAWAVSLKAAAKGANSKRIIAAIEAERAEAKAALDAAFKLAIAACTKGRMTIAAWRAAGSPELPPSVEPPALILPLLGESLEQGVRQQPDYAATHHKWHTDYHDSSGKLLFSDHRIAIVVHRHDPDPMAAALRLAADRWGVVRVQGSPAFVEKSRVVAAKLGIDLVGGDGLPIPVAPMEEVAVPVAVIVPPIATKPVTGPVHRRDPARQREIADIVAFIDRSDPLPMQRRASVAAGRLGALELVVTDSPLIPNPGALKTVVMSDDDPEIQRALERNRARMLEVVLSHLTYARAAPIAIGASAAHSLGSDDLVLRRSAILASGDADFMLMMQRVKAHWESVRLGRQNADHRRRLAIEAALKGLYAAQTLPLNRSAALEASLLEGDLWIRTDANELVIHSNQASDGLVDELVATPGGRETLRLLSEAVQASPEYVGSRGWLDCPRQTTVPLLPAGAHDTDAVLLHWFTDRGVER